MLQLNAQQSMRRMGLLLGLFFGALNTAWAEDGVESLVDEILAIQRDILGIEQQLDAAVGDDRVIIYFDMETLPLLDIDVMELIINGDVVVSQRVTPEQREAFNGGAVQKLYVGALAPGQHQVEARFEGQKQGAYAHKTDYLLEKGSGVDVVRLSIIGVFHQKESEFISYPEFIFR